jgi:hypothetical protein
MDVSRDKTAHSSALQTSVGGPGCAVTEAGNRRTTSVGRRLKHRAAPANVCDAQPHVSRVQNGCAHDEPAHSSALQKSCRGSGYAITEADRRLTESML